MSDGEKIIVAPFEVYLAPVGESVPDLADAPSGNWAYLGGSGKVHQAEGGVTVTHEQTIVEHRTEGVTAPIKVSRTEESLTIGFTLVDMTLEEYAKILNGVTVTDTAAGSGTAGVRKIPLRQGPDVNIYALLLRGQSPYGASYQSQYAVAQVYQAANPAPVFTKGDMAGLECEWHALEAPSQAGEGDRFGELQMQDAAAL